ncbi:MAG: allene oxide cyclase barrel-like domain-containing protein [Acidimicrobiia bacterium]
MTALVASAVLFGGFIVASPAAWANGLDDFELTGEFTDFESDDTGRDGPSEGDTFDFKMDLFDEDGDDAGEGDGTCELTDVNRRDREFTADCEAVFNLDDGDLEMEGEVTDEDFSNREVVLDITGGTDDYDDAEGTVTFTPADDHHGKGGRYHSTHADHGGHGGHGDHGDRDHGDRRGDHKVDIDVDFD